MTPDPDPHPLEWRVFTDGEWSEWYPVDPDDELDAVAVDLAASNDRIQLRSSGGEQ